MNDQSRAAFRSHILGSAAASRRIALATSARAVRDIKPEEAHAIAVDAYVYFYPIVTMDITRMQLTNVEAGKSEIGGPMNTFANVKAFPYGRDEGGGAPQLRHALFERLARSHQGAR